LTIQASAMILSWFDLSSSDLRFVFAAPHLAKSSGTLCFVILFHIVLRTIACPRECVKLAKRSTLKLFSETSGGKKIR
jgi:hypothetical protein